MMRLLSNLVPINDKLHPIPYLVKNICSKTLISLLLKPLPRRLFSLLLPFPHLNPLHGQLDTHILHRLAHLSTPTHVNLGPPIPQRKHVVCIMPQPILHILAAL